MFWIKSDKVFSTSHSYKNTVFILPFTTTVHCVILSHSRTKMFYKSDKAFSISHLQKHCVHCNTTAWNNFLAFLSNCTERPVVDKLKLEVNREEKQKKIKHLKVFHGWIYLKSSLRQFIFIFISSAFVCFNVCLILSWTPDSVFGCCCVLGFWWYLTMEKVYLTRMLIFHEALN